VARCSYRGRSRSEWGVGLRKLRGEGASGTKDTTHKEDKRTALQTGNDLKIPSTPKQGFDPSRNEQAWDKNLVGERGASEKRSGIIAPQPAQKKNIRITEKENTPHRP